MEVELLHDVVAVLLHGLDADEQVLGDILVPVPLRDELQNLFLPLAEQVQGVRTSSFLPARYPEMMVSEIPGDR